MVKLTEEFGKGFSSRNLRTMRKFYTQESINSMWSVRELQRQIGSLLYERLVLSRDKNKILSLVEK